MSRPDVEETSAWLVRQAEAGDANAARLVIRITVGILMNGRRPPIAATSYLVRALVAVCGGESADVALGLRRPVRGARPKTGRNLAIAREIQDRVDSGMSAGDAVHELAEWLGLSDKQVNELKRGAPVDSGARADRQWLADHAPALLAVMESDRE